MTLDLEGCRELARTLTRGRKDYRGRDWFHHDEEVMALLPADAALEEKMAALLHSLIDIGAASAESLLARGVLPRAVEIVQRVANGPDVKGHAAYVAKCRAVVMSGDKSAMRVKLADMLANDGHPTNDYRETIEIMREGLAAP